MGTNTSRLGLYKPAPVGEDVDIALLNENMDELDYDAGATICTSTTRPAAPYDGMIIKEADTRKILVWNVGTGKWVELRPAENLWSTGASPFVLTNAAQAISPALAPITPGIWEFTASGYWGYSITTPAGFTCRTVLNISGGGGDVSLTEGNAGAVATLPWSLTWRHDNNTGSNQTANLRGLYTGTPGAGTINVYRPVFLAKKIEG